MSVELRPWQNVDVELVQEAALDPFVARMAGIRRPCGRRAALHWIARRDSVVIVESASGAGVGEIGLSVDDRAHHGEFYYWVLPRYRGRGLATAAGALVCRRALQVMRVLSAYVSERNQGSVRVLEKLGFQRGGRCRRYAGYPGPRDTYTYFRFSPV